jgi:hypothetical protein
VRSKLGSTTLSPNIYLYSGTPLTTEVQVIDSGGWVYINGHGDMGRTPFFYQADLNLMHDFMPFKSHEGMKVRVEFSVFNLLNTSTVTDRYNLYSHGVDGAIQVASISDIFTKGINGQALMAAQGIRVDPRYGLANAFQARRQARVQLAFFF